MAERGNDVGVDHYPIGVHGRGPSAYSFEMIEPGRQELGDSPLGPSVATMSDLALQLATLGLGGAFAPDGSFELTRLSRMGSGPT